MNYGEAPVLFLAKSIEECQPEEAKAIRPEFYMDDLFTGEMLFEAAIEKRTLTREFPLFPQFPDYNYYALRLVPFLFF